VQIHLLDALQRSSLKDSRQGIPSHFATLFVYSHLFELYIYFIFRPRRQQNITGPAAALQQAFAMLLSACFSEGYSMTEFKDSTEAWGETWLSQRYHRRLDPVAG
jgi:hypothetical protein